MNNQIPLNLALPTTTMEWVYLIGSAVVAILIIVVIFFMYNSVQERKKTTNIELPDLDNLQREERIKKMERTREEYSFETDEKINASEITQVDEDEIDRGKYISSKPTSDTVDEINDILSGKASTPKVVGAINLPDIDAGSPVGETAVDGSKSNDNTNVQGNEAAPSPQDTAKKEFTLPEI